MNGYTIAGIVIVVVGLIAFFILARSTNYRTPTEAKNYERIRNKLTVRDEEEKEERDTDEPELLRLPSVFTLVFALIIGIGAMMLNTMQDTYNDSYSYNVTSQAHEVMKVTLDMAANWMPLTMVGSILIPVFLIIRIWFGGDSDV